MEGLNVGLDSEDNQKRIDRLMEHTKEEKLPNGLQLLNGLR